MNGDFIKGNIVKVGQTNYQTNPEIRGYGFNKGGN